MALLRTFRSRSFFPPLVMGWLSFIILIGGVDSWFQKKVLIFFINFFSISFGIPWAFVKNWVVPPITIWIISLLPSAVGWLFDHWARCLSIFSRIGVQGSAWVTSLPIHAPSILTGSPSLAMWISSGIGSSSSLSFLVCFIDSR